MDSLTHTVLGACLGEAIAGKQLGKKAMLIGAVVNNLPDIDVVAGPFLEPAQGLLAHRGITHAILTAVVLSPLLALWLQKIFRKKEVSFRRMLLLTGSGLFMHILMDAFTSYGTGWFEPFNHARVSFNTLFIIDPFFLLPLLIAAVALLILKRSSARRMAWAKISLTISYIYLTITIFIKISVNSKVNKDLAEFNIPHKDYMVTPTPLNNLLWYVVAQNDSACYIAYYSVFDKSVIHSYEPFSKNSSLLQDYKNSPEVAKLIQFSKGYYQVKHENDLVTFADLRFGQIGGWYKKDAPFVYKFNIAGAANGAASLQQGRMESVGTEPLKALVRRIKGNP